MFVWICVYTLLNCVCVCVCVCVCGLFTKRLYIILHSGALFKVRCSHDISVIVATARAHKKNLNFDCFSSEVKTKTLFCLSAWDRE